MSLSPLSLRTYVTDVTLGASGLWLGTRAGAGGTPHYLKTFLAEVHGSIGSRICVRELIIVLAGNFIIINAYILSTS